MNVTFSENTKHNVCICVTVCERPRHTHTHTEIDRHKWKETQCKQRNRKQKHTVRFLPAAPHCHSSLSVSQRAHMKYTPLLQDEQGSQLDQDSGGKNSHNLQSLKPGQRKERKASITSLRWIHIRWLMLWKPETRDCHWIYDTCTCKHRIFASTSSLHFIAKPFVRKTQNFCLVCNAIKLYIISKLHSTTQQHCDGYY